MNRVRTPAFVWLACLTMPLLGCSDPEPPAPSQDEHKALQRTIQEPLDKARAAESQMQEKTEQLQRQLDDAQN